MTNAIPEFTDRGFLPTGLYRCSAQEVLTRFCHAQKRKSFEKAIIDVCDYSKEFGGEYIFLGGSFVTSTADPHDLDVVIVFKKQEHIPEKTSRLLIEGKMLDIMFCSLDDIETVDSFVHLLSRSRYGDSVGIIQIDLYKSSEEWVVRHPPDDKYEIIKEVYINREFINISEPCGILVTVHGILSTAGWNSTVVPIASSQGWTVAPFNYGFKSPDLLLNKKKRQKVIDEFRDWIYDVKSTYSGEVSVIAHSFGTYIVGAYISGFEFPPVTFNSLILTGSILNCDFAWEDMRGNKVCRILNEIAPNDKWVSWMPKIKWLDGDPLFGTSGTNGFKHKSDILIQSTNTIFNHNNVIRKDVVSQRWMPYLNANRYLGAYESTRYLINKYGKT